MKHMLNRGLAAIVFFVSMLLTASHAQAELADLADVPLGVASASAAVRPNVMVLFDDAISGPSDFLPQNVNGLPNYADSSFPATSCKSCSLDTNACKPAATFCSNLPDPIRYNSAFTHNANTAGNIYPPYPHPPYFASGFNQLYYNPDNSYSPGMNADGTSMPKSVPTAAEMDAYYKIYPNLPSPIKQGGDNGFQEDITKIFPNVWWCAPVPWPGANPFNPAQCRRNGIDNVGKGFDYFLYNSTNTSDTSKPLGGYPNATGGSTTSYLYPQFGPSAWQGNPYYFTISPNEYCSDRTLINCAPAKADGSAPAGYSIPAIVRYCKSPSLVIETTAASDPATSKTPSCRKTYDYQTPYIYPRFGRFRRVDIKPSNTTYPLSASAKRPDCANATYCTYAEEIQNFANWLSYYRTRQNAMKTPATRAFAAIDDRYRVGFMTTNATADPDPRGAQRRYLATSTFDAAQKSKFFDRVQALTAIGRAPLRTALSRVGRNYAGLPDISGNPYIAGDPLQYSCQKNFAIVTTANYWDATDGVNGPGVGNLDNVPDTAPAPIYVSRATGTLDGIGTVTTNIQSTTIVEQSVCTGSANTTFPSGTQTPCGCPASPAGLKRIKQRTVSQTSTTQLNDGVAAPPVISSGVPSFQNITTTCTKLITTADITINPNPTLTPGVVNSSTTAGGTANTLADVAMYYYKNDLRTSGPFATNNVPTNAKDINPAQHMVTATISMGVNGVMDFAPDYETNLTGDFAKIKSGASGCTWTNGICNWPAPQSTYTTTVDDLWHAGVNGRGGYYSVRDANGFGEALASILGGLLTETSAASASATSSPNVTPSDNFIYSSTYRTPQWDGEIVAQRIDPTSGKVLAASAWTIGTTPTSAQPLLDAKVSQTADVRTIYTFSAPTGSKLKPFLWANLTTEEQAGFANKCATLSQCSLLSPAEKLVANNGENLVNYLRGQTQYGVGISSVFRAREHVMGDPVNASPVFVRLPRYTFNDAVTPTYASFKSANAARQGMLYVAANDGMLHAFNGDTGQEMWAYVPRMVFPQLPALASENWDVNHRFIVDGTPTVMDVFDSSASAWKTILVAGLGKGGRGYYALDITNPNSPKGLWEACSDSSLCAISDDDFGFTYGSPIVSKLPTTGKWAALVTSGMNNVSPGTGRGFVFALDALTGELVKKIDTGAGDTTTPSGLAKISGYANNYFIDNTIAYVYGGDLLGNLWSIDMSAANPAVLKLAMLNDATGKPQSITTRPELSVISGSRIVYVGTGRFLGAADVADPATLSTPLPWAYQQSLYAIKDRGVALGNIRASNPGLVKQSLTQTSPTTRSTSNNAVDWNGKDGWYVDFNPANDSPGERVHLDPQLIQGSLIVATAVPSSVGSTTCAAANGDSWFYQFDYRSGKFVASASGAVVGEKFTGSLIVGISVVIRSDGTPTALLKLKDGRIADRAINTPATPSAGKRISWRELIQ